MHRWNSIPTQLERRGSVFGGTIGTATQWMCSQQKKRKSKARWTNTNAANAMIWKHYYTVSLAFYKIANFSFLRRLRPTRSLSVSLTFLPPVLRILMLSLAAYRSLKHLVFVSHSLFHSAAFAVRVFILFTFLRAGSVCVCVCVILNRFCLILLSIHLRSVFRAYPSNTFHTNDAQKAKAKHHHQQ